MKLLKILFFIFFSLRTIEGVRDVEYVESLSPDAEPPRPPPPPPMKSAAVQTLGRIASGMTRNPNRGNNAGASCSQECSRNSLPPILESSRGTPNLESRKESFTPGYCQGCSRNTEGSSSLPQLPKHPGISYPPKCTSREISRGMPKLESREVVKSRDPKIPCYCQGLSRDTDGSASLPQRPAMTYPPKCTSREISRDMPRLESREMVKKRDPNVPGFCQGRSRDTEGSASLPQLPKCPQIFPPTNIQNNEKPIKLEGRPESSSGTKGLSQPPKRYPESYRSPLTSDLQESKGKTNQKLWPAPPTNQAKPFPSSQKHVSDVSKTTSLGGSKTVQESPQKSPKVPINQPARSETPLISPSPLKNNEKNLSPPPEGASNAEKSTSTLKKTESKDTSPDSSKKDPSKLSPKQDTKGKETPKPSRGDESKETQNSVKSKSKNSIEVQGNEKEKLSLKPTPTPPPQTPKKKPLCQIIKDKLNAPWEGWGGLFTTSGEKDGKSSKEKNKQ